MAGSDGFTAISVTLRDGSRRQTHSCECKSCSVMFREPDHFTVHRQVVVGADWRGIKQEIAKRRGGGSSD